MTNYQLITDGFQTLRAALAPFIARELIKAYGNNNWWNAGVWNRLYDYQRRNIPKEGSYEELSDSLDIAKCLLLIDINWRNVFHNVLPQECRPLIYELKGARNKWAHFGGELPTPRDTWRTLDTMSRLCMRIDPDGASEIEELIGKIDHEEEVAEIKLTEADSKHEQSEACALSIAQTSPSQSGTWRFMPKAKWTKPALDAAAAKWCAEKQRTLVEGFNDLDFQDAAEATLAMPLMDDGRASSFRDAADNVIFLINDAKMMALTVSQADKNDNVATTDKLDGAHDITEAPDIMSSEQETEIGRQGRFDASNRFVHIPKKKASWTKDDILEIVDRWSSEHSRNLPVQARQWRLDTLADMVLSRFPEQSDPAISFNDSLPETLFAPDTRKLSIMTHL